MKDILDITSAEWVEKYRETLPAVWEMMQQCENGKQFEKLLAASIRTRMADTSLTEWQKEAAETLLQLIGQSDQPCLECSEEEMLHCCTLRQLWEAMRSDPSANHPDFYHELYKLFKQLESESAPCPTSSAALARMNRWPSALDEAVIRIQKENKERIISQLVDDTDRSDNHVPAGRFRFPEGIDPGQKRALVREWWEDHRFHLAMAIRDPEKLNRYLGYSLNDTVMQRLRLAYRKGIPFFITPYYLSLLNPNTEGYDDRTIRDYVIYSEELIDNFGSIRAWEREDIIDPEQGNAAGWLLPDTHSVHRRYPEVAILIPDTMGRACGGLCASCQRMYGFQHGNLNFDLDALKPQKGWLANLDTCLTYFENDSQLRDILITGGDALMSQNKTLRILLDEIYRMALRKRETNQFRAHGEKYAELQRVRLGTRLPVYLPCRINEELIDILREFRQKGMEAGISQFVIQTHFQSPLELTPTAIKAIKGLLSAGWVITNQLVFTVPASRRGHTDKLRHELNRQGVLCYYTFTVKGFEENKHLFAPNARSVQEQMEEKVLGKLSDKAADQLILALRDPLTLDRSMADILEENKLPFMATDRNVMNLPGVGKSMTYRLAGIDSEGCRILAFSHDPTRRHSPVIANFPEIYIRERKSIGAYLRQLRDMGEDPDQYETIWSYRQAQTEPRFRFYEYPMQPHPITEKITHLYSCINMH